MKTGVLEFGYGGFAKLQEEIERQGFCTVNLGDCAQSLAVRHVLGQIGIPENETVGIDRDDMSSSATEPTVLVMNGVFNPNSLSLPAHIIPAFVGFNAGAQAIRTHRDLLRRFQPIGCRDLATAEILAKHGISAQVTGCLTLTFPRRASEPTKPKTIIVYGTGAGALPAGLFEVMPKALLASVELIFNRIPVPRLPLSPTERRFAETVATSILRKLESEATLVITPLHHVAAPCIAMGIPTVICRKDQHARFSSLRTLVPVHTPETFGSIDWTPAPIDIESLKAGLMAQADAAIRRARTFIHR